MLRSLLDLVRVTALPLVLALIACAPTYQTVRLVNQTDRTIEQVYIFPAGSVERGASRVSLAPNATAQVQVASGNVEVHAVSAKVRLDETTRERREASQVLELRGPLELVFHDSNQAPPGVNRPGTRAIVFRVAAPPAPPAAPDAPAP